MKNNDPHFKMFVSFMVREGYDYDDAITEFKIISKSESLEAYKKVVRKGATLVLNRAKRIDIFCIYESAKKHALANTLLDSSI